MCCPSPQDPETHFPTSGTSSELGDVWVPTGEKGGGMTMKGIFDDVGSKKRWSWCLQHCEAKVFEVRHRKYIIYLHTVATQWESVWQIPSTSREVKKSEGIKWTFVSSLLLQVRKSDLEKVNFSTLLLNLFTFIHVQLIVFTALHFSHAATISL